MKLLWALTLSLLAFASTHAPVEAQSTACDARVRRNWDALSTTEKDAYKGALAAAMDSGAYIKFIEMHTEAMSQVEAHGQCMFTYWHRLFLIVFENMLRGQGDEFACVTIPYYNWLGAYNRVLSGACTTLGDCSAIATELGGFTSGSNRTLLINDLKTSGTCVTEEPLNHFCQASTSYSSVREQVFSGSNIGEMSPLVEEGCHADVHRSLGGAMKTLASPSDPIFWSHHAMVDALHTIFHKCRVGTKRLSFEEKANHPVAWTSCPRVIDSVPPSGPPFKPTDVVTMRTGENGANPINGSDDPVIGQYFKDVPNRFADLMDVRDLGDFSYSYELSGQLASMYTDCDGNSTARRLETEGGGGIDQQADTTTIASSESSSTYDDGKVDVIIVEDCDLSEQHVATWYNEAMTAMGGQCAENMADLERQACMFHDECLGGVVDFSEEFKATWGVKEARCKTIVNAINSGEQSIVYGEWREHMEAYFGCPVPASETTPTDQSQTAGPAFRRNWEAMSDADKETYKGAVASAMDSPAYLKFIQMHMEKMSEYEAHGQCMFTYWHRLFLVVFENMLRAQGDEYACVTIPYFNWMEANNRVLSGTCKTMGDCAAITTELGGFTSGSQQNVVINGQSNTGICVTEAPLNHFCQTTGGQCADCVPRGDWGSAQVPGSTSYASLLKQVFDGKNIGEMSPKVETGSHAAVHNTLGGTMLHFASPADPIFWSHHSMVDALHTIFHKCRVGTQRMTFEEKAADPVAWTSCARRDGGVFNPADIVTMRTGVAGSNSFVNGSVDPVIGQYFQGVPNRFADLMDVRDLGDFSYTYELSGQLASMYTDCNGDATTSTPTTTTPVATTTAPAPTTTTPVATTAAPVATTTAPVATTAAPVATTAAPVATTTAPVPTTAPVATTTAPTATQTTPVPNQSGQIANAQRFFNWLWNIFSHHHHHRNLAVEDGTSNGQQQDATTPAPSTDSPSFDDGKVDVIIVDDCSLSEQYVMTWYKQTTAAMGGQCAETIADLERQSCMFHDQCLGGVVDFSDEFKATWGLKEARCKTIVDAVNSGEQPIVYAAWRENMESFFGCPMPTNETSPGDQSQTTKDTATDVIQSV
ncbi:hypothetical protein BBJ28_00009837 [Nothophytophthora sp. Chile5]|nr:hypothetical protein BBJ28_00009837 [Nothophytophthora sp. Chile5]